MANIETKNLLKTGVYDILLYKHIIVPTEMIRLSEMKHSVQQTVNR